MPAHRVETAARSGAGHDARIMALIGTGHFLSHFHMLCLPPLCLFWRAEFGASFAELGLAVALMSGTTALLQTPVGFAVDRHGAGPFLVGGTLLMALLAAALGWRASLLIVGLLGVPVVAAVLVLSLLCAGSAQAEARSRRSVTPAPAE